MNDNPFPSLRWFLWLLVLVCFSVLAFGASGLAFLCGFRDRSALRCWVIANDVIQKMGKELRGL
ncbi:hypothetical protein TC41_0954 [Alicyclobacillus acidocaldarius subsp. acidocaldarius Tc-4-1]|uniref:Uncharacterized protein n=1 Tax=Alicyclobacillus acidocaldarius (strain Tc-4-1) TaxID=1048834 RepID=F8IFK5_ALIAT|nr:hypothetical protein TC41_0954 [Alicyclobacillus acidocaldarius subsp. acidocaldarius Tc-4-1]